MSASLWAADESLSANRSVRHQSYVTTNNQTNFTLTEFSYSVDTDSLYVYVSGVFQRPGIDYYELTPYTFQLANAVPAGTIVVAVAMVEVNATVSRTVVLTEAVTAIAGQTVIPIETFEYPLGGNHLKVFVDGLLQYLGDQYTETTSTSITFTSGLAAGAKILLVANLFVNEINSKEAGDATAVTMTGSDVVLSPTQYGKSLIVITGALTGNLNLIFPNTTGQWDVINSTTGGYTITAKTAAGTGVPLGGITPVFGDGNSIYAANADSVQIVSNVAKLRTITPNASRVIKTSGYYAAGDNGDATYSARTGAAPGTYVDNGGTIVVPTGGDGSSAWLLFQNSPLTVRQFGAKGDGNQDDTAFIQKAIDYVNGISVITSGMANGGTELRIPGGRYKVSGLTLKNGVSIKGDGRYQTLLLMTANGGTMLKSAAANTQSSADNVAGCTYSDFAFAPDPATTFSSPTKLWDLTGFTLGTWKSVQGVFSGNITAWSLIGATLAGSGGPSNWYNTFYDPLTIGIGTGGIGWDLGDTSSTKEQITTWNWYSGRTASQGATGVGMRLNSATGCNLYGHTFENLSNELIIGSAAGTRGCQGVNLFGCYFEGASGGYTIYPNATDTQIIGGFATGVTNTDNGTRTTILNDGQFKFPVNNVADAFDLVQSDSTNKPQVKGSSGPGWRLNNSAGNWLDIWNGAATSSATDYLRVDDIAGRTLLKAGAAGVQMYGTQLSIGNQSAVSIFIGSGTPEGVVTASVGSLFMRTDGGAGTSLYVKQSGAGNTGWIGK